jgi:hypothetical protein
LLAAISHLERLPEKKEGTVHEGYDTAQICPNGHTANDSMINSPEFNKEFCEICGEKTLSTCPKCNAGIRGSYWSPGIVSVHKYHPPNHCRACGAPFPWTQRAIEAAIALSVESGGLQGEDADKFAAAVKDLVIESPQTPLAASRFKKLVAKAGKETAGAIRDVLVDIVSETAKKTIWPHS